MDLILVEKVDQICIIKLNRPEKYNSFIRPMALEFQAVLDECDNDDSIRCVLLTGEGKAFCAGQDLNEATDPEGPELSTIVSEHYNPIILKMRQLSKPIVVAVNGVAAGAGANIALAGDIVLAAESASFIQAFSKIGLIPDSGGTYTLPRLIGFQRASAYMMLGDKITAKVAKEIGMIYEWYPDAELMNHAFEISTRLSNMPTYGLALTKKALNATYNHSLNDQLEMEDRLQTLAGMSEDYKEGTTAFLEKRTPQFKGK
ncbi:MAG: enoyl-CoA hydratase/isomerase family protein [Saprospiraceae bacterium]|nr:enoyl-CoA hydratase/isomerase family protein [Saprospiraceae bacterium]MCB9309019.1 enoyl-CoA hydratase/isomerase family protein [Lewinellaceae bacterium]